MPPSLNDQEVDTEIAADWASIREKHAAEPADEPETPVAETDAPETTEAAAPDAPAATEKPAATTERPRDEAGRFAKADDKPAEKPEKAAAVAAPSAAAPSPSSLEVAAAAAPAPDAPARDITRPPSTWKPAAREQWDKVPDALRAEIHRREGDFLNGQQQLLPDARLGATMRQTIEPYRMIIEAEGGTPEGAVGNLLRTAAILRMGSPDQKLAAITTVAKQFGVDLTRLAPQIGGTPSAETAPSAQMQDPRVDSLLENIRQQEQQRAASEQRDRESAALQWMNELDAQGKPLRPYVNDVMTELTALVPQIRQAKPGLTHAQALQEAYDRATWAHPEVRALLQQAQQADLEQRRRTENQTRVTEAKRAASTNAPRRASIPTPGKPGRMEDTIEETARALGLINS